MRAAYKSAGASTVGAEIDHATSGGFPPSPPTATWTATASGSCRVLHPLPESIPIHLDHTMSAATVVARGRPYMRGDELRVDAAFGSTADAQLVRAKVKDGTLDSLSIVFIGKVWEDIDGVRTCVKGELLAADIVSVPSNRGARILSMRSYSPASEAAREAVADALLALARSEIAECKALGVGASGRHRRRARRHDPIRAHPARPPT